MQYEKIIYVYIYIYIYRILFIRIICRKLFFINNSRKIITAYNINSIIKKIIIVILLLKQIIKKNFNGKSVIEMGRN